MSVRRYLPLTLPALAEALAVGELPADAGQVVAEDDSEEAEYAALLAAGDVSAARVGGLADGARRRIVVVAQTDRGEGPVAWRDVVAVHADAVDDADPDEDLGWWATQEAADLVAHL